MASSSFTVGNPQWNYDVFLSFRGTNTRDSFTALLHDALCRNHVDAYIDTRLRGGEQIEPVLLKIIEESYISVVIFSENYADSSFCLRELSKILECKEKKGQEVIPVFWGVDPSHVQELTGNFGPALSKHKEKYCEEEVSSWERALKEIANGKGWDSNVTKPETLLLKEIVDDILEKLEKLLPSRDPRGLVGLDSRANHVVSLLRIESLDIVCTVGITGMGGIGKTTIAEVVYNRIFKQFDCGYFLRNVREELEKCTLVHLRDRIVSNLLGKENREIGTLCTLPTHFRRMIGRKKIVLVLDDVTSSQHLKALVGEDGLFGPGSRIIVTSSDVQVLRNVKAEIYEVENLSPHESFQLFASCACQEKPSTGEYRKLSKWMAWYCGGNPLALKVLGSNLVGRSIEYWRGEKDKLQSSGPLDTEIFSCLRPSFDGLDETQKDIFLDIACFFKTSHKGRVQELWELSDFHPSTGIPSLIDKCLINGSENNIGMHDLLQKLGQNIVCEVKDPRKRTRLWISKAIVNVLKHPKGTETIESISLDMTRIKEMELSPTVFEDMYNLRFLEFYNPECQEIKIHLHGGLELLPDKLLSLCWHQYPLKSLPSNFCAENLFELDLSYSRLEKLWDEFPLLEHLRVMDLRDSRSLIRTPDFSRVPNLKFLNLSGCTSLDKIPSSIDQYCSKLEKLNLSNCENLSSFPSCLNLKLLVSLSLCGCQKIKEFPKLYSSIKVLDLRKTAVKMVPSSVGYLSQLVWLRMDDCESLESVASSIGQLECLKFLDFPRCSKLANLPNSICDLKSLEHLNVYNCRKMDRLPESLGNIKSLRTLLARFSCPSREGPILQPFTEDWGHLTDLRLRDCGVSEIPGSLGLLASLRGLDLSCNKFKSIPPSIKQLSKLTHLILMECESLWCLPELPSNLKIVNVCGCSSLELVPSIVQTEYRADGELFHFGRCFKLKQNGIYIKIMHEAEQRIHRLATTLCYQGYDVASELCARIQARFCIPGSEVPEWFSHQNTQGSSVIEVKPQFDGSRFLGCAFCVVLAGHDIPVYAVEGITCECRLVTESRGHETIDCSWNDSSLVYSSDHIFVWYNSNLSYNDCFIEASFQFDTISAPAIPQHKGKVIKCGVTPLFASGKSRLLGESQLSSHLLRLLRPK